MAKSLGVTPSHVLKKGGVLALDKITLAHACEQAQKLGIKVFVVSCDKARNTSAVLRAISKTIDYPFLFGADIDSLTDCLCDTLTDQKHGMLMVLRHVHQQDEGLLCAMDSIKAIFQQMVAYAHERGKVFVYAIEEAGKHEDE